MAYCLHSDKPSATKTTELKRLTTSVHLSDDPSSLLSRQVLPHDPQARRQFVTSGCLRKVQEIQAEPGTELREYINTINNCFPEEIVR